MCELGIYKYVYIFRQIEFTWCFSIEDVFLWFFAFFWGKRYQVPSAKSGLPQLMTGFHSGPGANHHAGLFPVSETDHFPGPKILVLAELLLLLVL